MNDTTHHESQNAMGGQKLNWLRASVLGANDGIVSVAALVVGIAGATESAAFILTAGIAGIISGALSMAAGEYVSVSTQRDTERALLEKEKWELENQPEQELEELTQIYQAKGLTRETAAHVAQELTKHDAFGAHVEAELHIDPEDLVNPWYAAIASGLSFTLGGVIPVLAIILPPAGVRIPSAFIAVIVALSITGALSAYAGGAGQVRAVIRVVLGGLFAMVITYIIGKLFGVALS